MNKNMFKILHLFLLSIVTKNVKAQRGCSIDLVSLQDPQPLILSPNFEILYPDSDNPLQFSTGDQLLISCIETQFASQVSTKRNTTQVTCLEDGTFEDDDGAIIDFSTLQCKEEVKAGILKAGLQCGTTNLGDDADVIIVGFNAKKDFTKYRFVELLRVCFDKYYRKVVYVNYQLTKSIVFKANLNDKPSDLIEDPDAFLLDKITLKEIFSTENSIMIINTLLGLELDSAKYITTKFNEAFLADPSSNFFFKYQSREAARYLNIFPQWPQDNPNYKSNWDTLNENIIKYITTISNSDLEIYSGTYSTFTLPHESTRRAAQIHLYANSSLDFAIPVPLLTWKVLYDKNLNRAIALIVANPGPQVDGFKREDLIICNDISWAISWMDWDLLDERLGLTYACSYKDLREKVPHLPRLWLDGNLI